MGEDGDDTGCGGSGCGDGNGGSSAAAAGDRNDGEGGKKDATPAPKWALRFIPKRARDWLYPPTRGQKVRALKRTATAGTS
jgi:hypothetical protein